MTAPTVHLRASVESVCGAAYVPMSDDPARITCEVCLLYADTSPPRPEVRKYASAIDAGRIKESHR